MNDMALIQQENIKIRTHRLQSGESFHRGIISAYSGMLYNEDTTLAIDSMIKRLLDLGVNCYTYLIYPQSEKELAALPEFCKKAADLGIEVWVYLVPPSEAPEATDDRNQPIADRPSTALRIKKYPPFDLDYIRWAEAISQISLTHLNLTLWMIDDFDGNMEFFTLEYTKKIYQTSKQINPNLKVGYCVYHDGDRLTRFVDGGYLPYCDGLLWGYQHNFRVEPNAGISPHSFPIEINDYYKICGDRLIIPCIYFKRHSSWPDDRPRLEYLEQAMKIAYEQAGVVWLFNTPKPNTPAYNMVKEYTKNMKLIKWSN
jgi:hypothetical protein